VTLVTVTRSQSSRLLQLGGMKIKYARMLVLGLRCWSHCLKLWSFASQHQQHQSMCTLNHCLEWDKWVLTNSDPDRQWFNTLIPPSHESAACILFVTPSRTAISRLSGPVRLSLRYTTPDIHCRYECDSGITHISEKWTDHAYARRAYVRFHSWDPNVFGVRQFLNVTVTDLVWYWWWYVDDY